MDPHFAKDLAITSRIAVAIDSFKLTALAIAFAFLAWGSRRQLWLSSESSNYYLFRRYCCIFYEDCLSPFYG